MFHPFQNFITRAATKYGISKEFHAIQICNDFKNAIKPMFPQIEDLESHISPAFYRDGTIFINVDSSAIAQEIIMRKTRLIEEINKKQTRKVIKNLQTLLNNKPKL